MARCLALAGLIFLACSDPARVTSEALPSVDRGMVVAQDSALQDMMVPDVTPPDDAGSPDVQDAMGDVVVMPDASP